MVFDLMYFKSMSAFMGVLYIDCIIIPEIEMRSSGGAGEHQGDQLGVYIWYQALLSDDGTESHVYKQRHDGYTENHFYIYRFRDYF